MCEASELQLAPVFLENGDLQVSLIGGALNSSPYDVCATHVALRGGLGR
jgi:hypothetical protein